MRHEFDNKCFNCFCRCPFLKIISKSIDIDGYIDRNLIWYQLTSETCEKMTSRSTGVINELLKDDLLCYCF